MNALGLFLHHAESVDPTLWEWIEDKIDGMFGLSAVAIVVILGTFVLAFPIGLMALAIRRARSASAGR